MRRKKDIRDPAGRPVDLDECPDCSDHPDCFAWRVGKCMALNTVEKPCSFYRNAEENRTEIQTCYELLVQRGRSDLIRKYKSSLIAFGVFDQEFQDAGDFASELAEYRKKDYQDQLLRALEGEDNSDLLE